MKKILFVFLIMFASAFLFACGEDEKNSDNEQKPQVEYNVSFVVDGVKTTVVVAQGEKASKPVDPEKECYIFVGWYDGEEAYDFEKAVTKDVELVAKFEEVKVEYSVTFVVDGEKSEVKVAEGEKASKPADPEKVGYVFLGWYVGDEEYNFENVVISDLEVVAKFEEVKVEYTVSFVADGKEVTKQTVKEGEKASKPADLEKVGYVFLGWYVGEEAYDFDATVTADITLTAKFEEVELVYQISFGEYDLFEGDTLKVSIESNINVEFEYTLDNDDLGMITPDDSGFEFLAFEAGVVTVTVTPVGEKFADKVQTFEIVINKVYSAPINILLDGSGSCKLDEFVELTVTILPQGAKQEYYYVIENNEIGYMDADKFVPLKEGTTKITVYHCDGNLSASMDMTVYIYDVNETVKLYDGVERVMTSAEYWIDREENTDEVLLTLDQIEAFNKKAYVTNNTKLVDILNQNGTITGSNVKQMINSYSMSSSVKINGSLITNSYMNELKSNMDLNSIQDNITVKYGIVNEFSALRRFPTNDVATTTNSFDRWQETGLEVGNGCLIYHTSKDGNWYFIQMFNYYGWVEKTKVTEVTKSEMTNYVEPKDFVIVVCKDMVIGNVKVRMSTKVPVLFQDDNTYTLSIIGKSGLEMVKVEKSDKLHFGYLDYTKANIYTQIFKLLDEPYRWGDCEFDGHDCSSTMNAVYHCFGFKMSRNTSNQECLPYTQYHVQGQSDAAKKAILDNLQVGSLVFVDGHVMMYLGKVGSDYYIIHNFNSYGGCNITTSRLIRSGSTTYMGAYTEFLEFK